MILNTKKEGKFEEIKRFFFGSNKKDKKIAKIKNSDFKKESTHHIKNYFNNNINNINLFNDKPKILEKLGNSKNNDFKSKKVLKTSFNEELEAELLSMYKDQDFNYSHFDNNNNDSSTIDVYFNI